MPSFEFHLNYVKNFLTGGLLIPGKVFTCGKLAAHSSHPAFRRFISLMERVSQPSLPTSHRTSRALLFCPVDTLHLYVSLCDLMSIESKRRLSQERSRKMSHAASPLADSTSTVKGDPTAPISVANLFRVKNELRGFSLAFP